MMQQFVPSKRPSGPWPNPNSSLQDDDQIGPNLMDLKHILASLNASGRLTPDAINAPYGSGIRASAQ